MLKEESFQKLPRNKEMPIPVITQKTPSKESGSTRVEK